MQQRHDLDSLGYNGLLELAHQQDCPDEVFNRLLDRYAVDDMWAKRIVEHPNAQTGTKMRIMEKGYHLKAPGVAEALLSALPSTAHLVDELRVAYADYSLNLNAVGVKTGVLEQHSYPLLHSAVGDLIKPEYHLGKVLPVDGAKLTPSDANDLVTQFCNAYKDYPGTSAIPNFVTSILQRSDRLNDQSIWHLIELESSSSSPRNFLTSVNDVNAILRQKSLSENVIGKALERSSGVIYGFQSVLKESFIYASDQIQKVVRSIGVSLDDADIKAARQKQAGAEQKSKFGLLGVIEDITHRIAPSGAGHISDNEAREKHPSYRPRM
ncbi:MULTISPECIES: hypothetical protein [Aeromonas]|uniref:hypothetical protein n=1 Tax=Aeromonas TaxID=642 RepID=UPI002B057164|nr:hypothetical protein [Aeromonas jandaei]